MFKRNDPNRIYKILFFLVGFAQALNTFSVISYIKKEYLVQDSTLSIFAISFPQIVLIIFAPIISRYMDKNFKHFNVLRILIFIMMTMSLLLVSVHNVYLAFAASVALSFAFGTTFNILDRSANIHTAQNGTKYSSIRLFASIGFGVSLLLLSFISLVLRIEFNNIYFVTLFTFPIIWLVNKYSIGRFNVTNPQPRSSGIKKPKLDSTLILYMIMTALLIGSGVAITYSYSTIIFSQYNDQAIPPELFQGIAIFFGSLLTEVPAFMIYPRVRNKIGLNRIMVLVFSINIIRYFIALAFNNPYLILISFLGHGFVFAFIWSTFMDVISTKVKKENQQTSIGFYSSLNSIGSLSSTLLVSFIAAGVINAQLVYTYTFITTILAMTIYFVIYSKEKKLLEK
jgi:MFS family permease